MSDPSTTTAAAAPAGAAPAASASPASSAAPASAPASGPTTSAENAAPTGGTFLTGATTTKDAGATAAAGSSSAPAGQPAADPYATLKLPDGAKPNPDLLSSFKAMAAKSGATVEQAQAMIDWQLAQNAAATKAAQQAHKEAVENQRKAWREEIARDKEIGGEHTKATQEAARRALTKYGDPALIAELDKGLGDFPALVRFIAKVGKALGDDSSSAQRAGYGAAKPSRDERIKQHYQNSARPKG